jgi:Mg2+ and Co2+ transporter CorA
VKRFLVALDCSSASADRATAERRLADGKLLWPDLSDLVDSYRDLLSGAMDAYLSIMSSQLNAVMKEPAVIATVFLPLSFLTGFFGQNFPWLAQHLSGLPAFLVFGLGTEAAPRPRRASAPGRTR